MISETIEGDWQLMWAEEGPCIRGRAEWPQIREQPDVICRTWNKEACSIGLLDNKIYLDDLAATVKGCGGGAQIPAGGMTWS